MDISDFAALDTLLRFVLVHALWLYALIALVSCFALGGTVGRMIGIYVFAYFLLYLDITFLRFILRK